WGDAQLRIRPRTGRSEHSFRCPTTGRVFWALILQNSRSIRARHVVVRQILGLLGWRRRMGGTRWYDRRGRRTFTILRECALEDVPRIARGITTGSGAFSKCVAAIGR